jgi:hypothetical protein
MSVVRITISRRREPSYSQSTIGYLEIGHRTVRRMRSFPDHSAGPRFDRIGDILVTIHVKSRDRYEDVARLNLR